jgi:hypothetical protein
LRALFRGPNPSRTFLWRSHRIGGEQTQSAPQSRTDAARQCTVVVNFIRLLKLKERERFLGLRISRISNAHFQFNE